MKRFDRCPRWLTLGFLLVGMFLIAFWLRIWVAAGGLPYVEHIDEPAVLERAIRMVRDGDPNPNTFRYPSLYYYLLAATTQLHIWWGIAAGVYQSAEDIPFKHYGITSTPLLYIWGRTLTALLGAATVPALFILGRRMFDRRVGLLAAALLTITVYHLRHSRFITVDVPTGLWVVIALIGAWQIAADGRWRGYLLAGIGAGLAAGTKYNAGAVVLAIGLAHFIHWRFGGFRLPLWRLLAAAGTSLLTFLITTPFAIFDNEFFIAELRFNAWHYSLGEHGDFIGAWPVAEYASFFWDESIYPVGVIFLLVGLPLLIRRFPAQVAILAAAIIPTLLLLLQYTVHFTRNVLPILPLVILLVAAGAVAIADLISRRFAPRAAPVVLGLCAAVLLVPNLVTTYNHLDYWGRTHSMVRAAEELRNLPKGMRIAAELPSNLFPEEVMIFPVRRITDYSLEWYRANGFRYLAANDDLRSDEDRATYAQLHAAADVLVAYPPRRAGAYPGPSGAILDLGVDPAWLQFTPRPMQFGDQFALLGYEIRPGDLRGQIDPLEGAAITTFAPGAPAQINLYWRVLKATGIDYVLFVHVVDAAGNRVAQRDLPLRVDEYPSSRWQTAELVIDRADLPLPALPPGTYQVLIGLYDPADGARLPSPDTPLLTLIVE